MQEETKLRNCPFCGGEAEFMQNNEPWYAVNCKNGCVHTGNHNQDYKATKRWNTRAADKTIAQLVEALEKARLYIRGSNPFEKNTIEKIDAALAAVKEKESC